MKLIVGLGNPDLCYKKTRHNLGFMIIDNYLGEIKWNKKFNALIYRYKDENSDILFMKPQEYMNNSGNSIRKIVDYYKINIEDILIIYDDLDLEIGKYKVKSNSSSGGHNGIKSIISSLGTESFARLKVGINNNSKIDGKTYVLSDFTKEEKEIINQHFDVYDNIIDYFIINGREKTMNLFNRKE